ncbi:MAG: hypothetical protein KIS61_33800 [Candidatus Eremiobacteraeota bacterium]|nr:hypothetical protein [Candidatus Eremiobacteraeota bacterium]
MAEPTPFATDPQDQSARLIPKVLFGALVLGGLSFLLLPLLVQGTRAYESIRGFFSFWSGFVRFFDFLLPPE